MSQISEARQQMIETLQTQLNELKETEQLLQDMKKGGAEVNKQLFRVTTRIQQATRLLRSIGANL